MGRIVGYIKRCDEMVLTNEIEERFLISICTHIYVYLKQAYTNTKIGAE